MLCASKSLDRRSSLGAQGELYVATWLVQQGYTIQARNYRTRSGEIDIIATKKGLISFVEVKVRSEDYFNLSEVVVPRKQKKIYNVARSYLVGKSLNDLIIRFDIALLHGTPGSFVMNYVPNAFTPSEGYV